MSQQSEVVFASLKIMLIIGLIIGGLIINLGGGPDHERIGFRYWQDPGAFNSYIKTGAAGNFLAFWKVMLPAAFSYGNIQVVAISGSETRGPTPVPRLGLGATSQCSVYAEDKISRSNNSLRSTPAPSLLSH